ncbi:hypothetical protein U8C37_05485 [Sinorhizobium medicae]|uniref:hypothetical protein n=1 Tax=Sinorhizobium medicae TaxID=110321 RepID=UPI002AF6A05B|nr:hypothetical protein [Sinorhizobium medicae]WQO86835.1 hypothetical protein U8C37_05485 [Sinorhizobium medicae]
MTARYRPIHSSFETLRYAGPASRAPFGTAANEQMTAMALARTTRPAQIFSELIQR